MTSLLFPLSAAAHGFGALYNLPVPLWLYGWGASSALVLSFFVVAFFATSSTAAPLSRRSDDALPRLRPLGAAIGVVLLLLCIATGLFGNRDPYRNFSMTFFWVVFALGCLYLAALVGDFWAAINPWRLLTRPFDRARVRYPERFGDWPAAALYVGFVAFELFNHGKPSTLGAMLLGYTVLNMAGVATIGASAWFTHCELFSVLFRLAGKMALRGQALYRERPASVATLTFALAMLSTTVFDGLRATQWWVNLFWRDGGFVANLAGTRPILAYADLRSWFIAWESFWLVASPFLYLGAYLAAIATAKLITRNHRSIRELALDFGYTLLPIALVYNLTHYATLILTQGTKIVSLASDPFGWGWNLLGTAHSLRAPILPGMGVVWHTQVALIVIGHIASVYCAHLVALRIFPTRRAALVSQLPMLALMVAFTVAGLWILAQPLTELKMR
ncbi:MAG TPA: hypothetical protein VFB36_05815 [Nevskiaceae bacterium]|nr:hypothetical protein [Nevskiaceae bacterium]